ncbi:MAG: hypothetical protein K2Y14_04210 [Burkholderiales bacterium]|nr:hypothetical protein [Burkholderiales bacterium]
MTHIIDKLEPLHLAILLGFGVGWVGYILARGVVVRWGDKEFRTGKKND